MENGEKEMEIVRNVTLEYMSRASVNFSVLIKLLPSVFSLSASSLSAAEGGPFLRN